MSDSFNPFRISEDSHEMSRQDSIGAQSARTSHSSAANAYEQAQSARMYHGMPQVPYQMSSPSSDGTGSSHSPEYTPQPPHMDSQNIDNFPSFQGDQTQGHHSIYHRDSTSNVPSHVLVDSSFPNGFATSGNDSYMSTYLSTQVLFNDSPTLFDDDFLDGQRPPPMIDEFWALPPGMMSPTAYSPSEQSLSPPYGQEVMEPPRPIVRALKKTGPRQSKVNSDIARNSRPSGASEASEESLKYTGRTPDVDNNARVHELYHNASPQADGLYHCPWEGQDVCQHRPEKLKCNYEYDTSHFSNASCCMLIFSSTSKFVDSHLKPYRCKTALCENLQFSSTACLLRHEREAHAMHGHGEKPFLCTYEGCDRSVSGNGFPRHWNLRDHMRRVHNDSGPAKSTASGGSPPPSVTVAGPTRSKKRKVERPVSPVIHKVEKVAKRMPDTWDPETDVLYQQSYDQLLTAVQKLKDPRVAGYEQLFTDAYGNFQAIQDTAREINSYRCD